MTTEEIIQEMKRYCEAGLLEGLEIDAVFGRTKYRMVDVQIGGNGCLYFNQYRFFGDSWGKCQSLARVMDQCQPYLEDCLKEMRRLIKRDKNLF